MHYVKHFDILGVNTAQIPCIELQGVPNSATEGAVGLLGMNMLSEDHEIYICVAVNGSVYTWKPLKDGKDGVCIVKTELNENGELLITLSDGTVNNVGVVKGEPGKQGEKGEQADLTKIKEKNKGRHLGVWFGDKETFNGLSATEENTTYILEDDDTLEQIDAEFEKINNSIEVLNESVTPLTNEFPNIVKIVTEAESIVGKLNSDVISMRDNVSDIGSRVVNLDRDINDLESRFEALGFNPGNINVFGIDYEPQSSPTSRIFLERFGNFVIGCFKFKFDNLSSVVVDYLSSVGATPMVLPDNFTPNAKLECIMSFLDDANQYDDLALCEINTDGTVKLKTTPNILVSNASKSYTVYMNFGFEAPPIE